MRASLAVPVLFAGVLCAFPTLADESWRNKPPAEWNKKELREILEHSPWAHRVSLMLVPPAVAEQPCAGSSDCMRTDSFREPPTTNTNAQIGGGAGPRAENDLEVETEKERTQNRYSGPLADDNSRAPLAIGGVSVIRWASAATIRDALARSVPPSGKLMDAEQLAQLSRPDAYVVYVDLRVGVSDVAHIPQAGMLTQQMARRSFLISKSARVHIPAARVVRAPMPEFDDRKQMAIAAYYIYFPKRMNGKSVFPEGETEVRFECPLRPVPIRADFKLSHMQREGSPDY